MDNVIVFRGSVMDGSDVDLVDYCGLPALTDEQHDAIWGEVNETDLLELCDNAEVLFSEGTDDMPGQSDTYYDVLSSNPAAFKEELKKLILKYSGQS